MTPEQFAEWSSNRPSWISQETATSAACIKDISDYIDYDIGPAIRGKHNGDAMWYALTDSSGSALLVLMCTPHAIFTETTIATDDIEYGVRRLTPDEIDNFIHGIF